jgi:hypothetical protein
VVDPLDPGVLAHVRFYMAGLPFGAKAGAAWADSCGLRRARIPGRPDR